MCFVFILVIVKVYRCVFPLLIEDREEDETEVSDKKED